MKSKKMKKYKIRNDKELKNSLYLYLSFRGYHPYTIDKLLYKDLLKLFEYVITY